GGGPVSPREAARSPRVGDAVSPGRRHGLPRETTWSPQGRRRRRHGVWLVRQLAHHLSIGVFHLWLVLLPPASWPRARRTGAHATSRVCPASALVNAQIRDVEMPALDCSNDPVERALTDLRKLDELLSNVT